MSIEEGGGKPVAGLVSIVIPCYKGERYLIEAIESCLRQTYNCLEVIVVDDASPDHCAEIGDRYGKQDKRVHVIRRERNGGISAALNTGYSAARGEFFTRLAQDDVFRQDAILLMKDKLDMDQDAGLVYCDMQFIDELGRSLGVQHVKEPQEALATGNDVGICVMWRKSVWDAVGMFGSEFDTSEDYEYWLRVARQFKIAKIADEAPFFSRLHDEQGSRRFQARQVLTFGLIQARYCGSWWRACRFKSQGYFEAGFVYREQGAFGLALCHSLAAIGWWPFTLRNYRCLLGVAAKALMSPFNSMGKVNKL